MVSYSRPDGTLEIASPRRYRLGAVLLILLLPLAVLVFDRSAIRVRDIIVAVLLGCALSAVVQLSGVGTRITVDQDHFEVRARFRPSFRSSFDEIESIDIELDRQAHVKMYVVVTLRDRMRWAKRYEIGLGFSDAKMAAEELRMACQNRGIEARVSEFHAK